MQIPRTLAGVSRITRSRITDFLKRQRPIRALEFGERNHVDRVPRAAFEERAVGAFAGANLQPMQSRGSTMMRPNGAWSSSGAQYMQSATGQYSTQAGEPEHPVQHSLITARMWGFLFRCVVVPVEIGAVLDDCSRLKFLDARSRICHVEPPKCGLLAHILAERTLSILSDSALRRQRCVRNQRKNAGQTWPCEQMGSRVEASSRDSKDRHISERKLVNRCREPSGKLIVFCVPSSRVSKWSIGATARVRQPIRPRRCCLPA